MRTKTATLMAIPLVAVACCLVQSSYALAQGSGSRDGSHSKTMENGAEAGSHSKMMGSEAGSHSKMMGSEAGSLSKIMEGGITPQETANLGKNVGTAIFAGGCFWCEEANFEKYPQLEVISGYTGGHVPNPTYKQVGSDTTGHRESVFITYDKRMVTYNDLLEIYWRTINPTDAGGSFYDRGEPYTSAIFVANEEQRKLAEASRQKLAQSGRFKEPIVTRIINATTFYPAEGYHQNYHLTHPRQYYAYRNASGRDQYIAHVWGNDAVYKIPKRENAEMMKEMEAMKANAGPVKQWTDAPLENYKKPSDAELRKKLTNIQYWVTQESGTEPPFKNPYWNEHREGIFVDVVSGEPLFSSKDKFQSGTGWPSFSKPLVEGNLEKYADNSYSMERTEVRSHAAKSHIGHIFKDGPPPTGLRYCTDSASLRFIPKDKLEAEGYGFFKSMVEK